MHYLQSIPSKLLSDFPTNRAENLDRIRPLLKLADARIARSDLTEALPLVIQAEGIASKVEAIQPKRAKLLALQMMLIMRQWCMRDWIENHPL